MSDTFLMKPCFDSKDISCTSTSVRPHAEQCFTPPPPPTNSRSLTGRSNVTPGVEHVISIALVLTLYFLVSSADILCKPFGPRPRSGQTKCQACSASEPFDTQYSLKNFVIKLIKKPQTTKKHAKLSRGPRLWRFQLKECFGCCRAQRGLPVGFGLLRYSVYLLLSPSPCFISFLYLDLYVLGDDAWIS